MKFSINQKVFYEAVNTVQRAVSKKKTLPILNGIYLETVKGKGIHLIATDLELGIENWIETEVEAEGSIVLPANNLTSIVRELPSEDIFFNINLDSFEAELKCLNSEFKIKGYNPEEFPALPEVNIPNKIDIKSNKFREIIEEVEFSTASEETQPALTGALMLVKEELIKLVSTNTYRLAYSQRPLNINTEEEINVILPGKTLKELRNLLPEEGEIEIKISNNYISFYIDQITVVSRLIEGQFPNYRQVMPDDYNTSLTVDRKKFKKAVKRASLIAKQDSNVISLKTEENTLIINTLDSDTGSAHEEIDIKNEGPEQNINIDAGYLLDVLKILKDEEVRIELIGPLNPMTVKRIENENQYIYLIMPVRPE